MGHLNVRLLKASPNFPVGTYSTRNSSWLLETNNSLVHLIRGMLVRLQTRYKIAAFALLAHSRMAA